MQDQKEKILKAVSELSKVDSRLGDNLEMLSRLAKNNPSLYQKAVQYLKSLV